MSRRIFTPGYVLYLLAVTVLIVAAARYSRRPPPLLDEMARPDYQDSPDRILRKIACGGLLYDLRPDVAKEEHGVYYATNSDGMRDDHAHVIEKTPGQRWIVFLGDSFTFGLGVELADTFVKQAAKRLDPRAGTCSTSASSDTTRQRRSTFSSWGSSIGPTSSSSPTT